MASSRLWALLAVSVLLSALMIAAGSDVGASPVPPTPELWLMDADGTDPVRIATGGYGHSFDWSPDGRRLAFWTDRLFVFDTQTGAQTQLTQTPDYPQYAEWSPRGDEIAYAFQENNVTGIRVVSADGSVVRTLLTTQQGPGWLVTGVGWSPDATQISFVQGPGSGAPGRVSVIDVVTGLTRQVSATEALYTDTEWAPTGSWISFLQWDYELHVVRPDGTDERDLTQGVGGASVSQWSPTGTEIVFDADANLYVVDATTLVRRRVLERGVMPSWSPDATRLAFSRQQDLFTVARDGSDVRQLTSDVLFDDTYPLWSPDGEHIAFVRTEAFVLCPGTPFPVEASIIGTEGDDRLIGTDGNDVIAGMAGDDVIHGGGGDDIICARWGADSITGGQGNDFLYGEDGNDAIGGGAGDDTVDGGRGDDRIEGSFGTDTVTHIGAWRELAIHLKDGFATGWGMDTLITIENAYGSTANDTLIGDFQANELHGSLPWSTRTDRDVLIGLGGADVLRGYDGGDWLRGGAGNDRLFGGPGNDACYGGPGADRQESC